MKEPTIATRRRPRLAGPMLTAATLLALAAACFARLAATPMGLIVDGERPSVDYANRGDPRPVGNDLTFLFLPHHGSIADRIARFGHRPEWDARGFGGRPLAGNPQAGMSYPPAWIAWRLRTPSFLGWLTVAHLLWGGFGTYILVRSMGAGRWASTIGAGVYQASPYLLAHTYEGHYPHVWAASWYPWAFWAYGRHREGRARGLLLAPILALTYLTGHPQEWLLLVMALSARAVADGIVEWRSGRGAARIAGWLVLLLISICVTSIDVMPAVLARPWLRHNHDPQIDGIPRRYHLGGLNAFQLLGPTALGGPADYFGDDNYWESVLSIGLVPLVLAMIASTRHPDRRLVRGWLGLSALAIAFACGRSLGLYPLCVATIPGIGLIRVAARSLFVANLAGAVLAGLGVQTLIDRMTDRDAWRRLARRLGVAAALAIVLLLAIHRGRSSAPDRPPTRVSAEVVRPASPPATGRTARAVERVLGDPRFWSAIGGTAILVGIGSGPIGVRRRRAIAGLIGLVGLGELGWYGFDLIRVAPAERFIGRDPVGEALAILEAGEDRMPRPPVRIKARDAYYGDLPASIHGIEKTNIDDAFQIDHASILYETLYPVASHARPMAERRLSPAGKETWRGIRQAVFDRMSVGYLVSDRVETDPAWPVAAEGTWNGSRFVIQRNGSAMPRAYVVPRAIVLPDSPGVVLTAMAGLDPRRAVVMTADPMEGPADAPRQPFTVAEWTSVDPDRPAWLATTRAPGLFVVADTWMPGWTATVDGRPAPVLRGNHAQRVIPLPEAGRHAIAMAYRPPGLRLGGILSLASGVAWVALVVRSRIRRVRPEPSAAIRGPLDVAASRRMGQSARIPVMRHPICPDLGE